MFRERQTETKIARILTVDGKTFSTESEPKKIGITTFFPEK